MSNDWKEEILSQWTLYDKGRITGVYQRQTCKTCKRYANSLDSDAPKHACTGEETVMQARFPGTRKSAWVIPPDKVMEIVNLWKKTNDVDAVMRGGRVVAVRERAPDAEKWMLLEAMRSEEADEG